MNIPWSIKSMLIAGGFLVAVVAAAAMLCLTALILIPLIGEDRFALAAGGLAIFLIAWLFVWEGAAMKRPSYWLWRINLYWRAHMLPELIRFKRELRK